MKVLALALALAAAGPAAAEVTEATGAGFQSRHQLEIAASPGQVWAALTQPARWWDPAHTFSGSAASLSLEARAGGCFCERLPEGGVQHLTVVHVRPGARMGLRGGLGPLAAEGVEGGMVFTLEPSGGGTRLVMTYTVGGYARSGLQRLAGPVDGVLAIQMQRLERLLETGRPDAAK